jgi:hypothetical protein
VPKRTSDSILPKEVVDHWPEVFEHINIDVVPLEYLHTIRVEFDDGKIWDIDVAKSIEKSAEDNLEATLDELFEQYQDVIVNVDFRLDTERLKRDIKKRTATFMKKRK